MKNAAHTMQPFEAFRPANHQALEELDSFLRAVDSYPERFAREPDVSFEQHLQSLYVNGLNSSPGPGHCVDS